MKITRLFLRIDKFILTGCLAALLTICLIVAISFIENISPQHHLQPGNIANWVSAICSIVAFAISITALISTAGNEARRRDRDILIRVIDLSNERLDRIEINMPITSAAELKSMLVDYSIFMNCLKLFNEQTKLHGSDVSSIIDLLASPGMYRELTTRPTLRLIIKCMSKLNLNLSDFNTAFEHLTHLTNQSTLHLNNIYPDSSDTTNKYDKKIKDALEREARNHASPANNSPEQRTL